LVAAGVSHGGTRPVPSVPLATDVERDIKRASVLAPLQNARSLEGIRAARMALAEAPQVAALDSGFHATMPQAAATYAVPEDWRQRFGIRRLGFHGINVQ